VQPPTVALVERETPKILTCIESSDDGERHAQGSVRGSARLRMFCMPYPNAAKRLRLSSSALIASNQWRTARTMPSSP